ncbi:hypothetical protein SK128_018050 [Halocaridina rubra]|uniref:Uncharacterized protein n=1 Tax=Halocaridina rubra TaxID=373956 RepID=A0AAN8ZYX8_HALRR
MSVRKRHEDRESEDGTIGGDPGESENSSPVVGTAGQGSLPSGALKGEEQTRRRRGKMVPYISSDEDDAVELTSLVEEDKKKHKKSWGLFFNQDDA